jgi:hypothetical protein
VVHHETLCGFGPVVCRAERGGRQYSPCRAKLKAASSRGAGLPCTPVDGATWCSVALHGPELWRTGRQECNADMTTADQLRCRVQYDTIRFDSVKSRQTLQALPLRRVRQG